MRLPVEWIKEYAAVQVSTEEIAERLTMAGLEVEEMSTSGAGEVLDVKVTPNRGDCLSVIGVARELAAAAGISMKAPPVQASAESAGASDLVSVTIDAPDDCPRYSARVIRNVRQIPSPPWMQDRLSAAGMRPIGGIVDVTNYVMLEMGQPLHAFDYDTLRGPAIVVRHARSGERLTTLDGIERELASSMQMICDSERPVAVAGVMGGGVTEVSESTRTVLLESAHFSPLSVRRTARALGLRTEASYRFERFVDPAAVVAASDRACQLFADLGMGEPVQGVVDAYVKPGDMRSIALRPPRASMLLGFSVKEEEIRSSLGCLGFRVDLSDSDRFLVTVPSWRPDVVREEDLVEEVGRVVGYEGIPEKLPVGESTQGGESEWGRFAESLRDILVSAGLQEVVTHSLLAVTNLEDPRTIERRVNIRSALSAELSGLRRSLLPGLIDTLERNARRAQGPLAFFETGKVFRMSTDGVEESPAIGISVSGPIEPLSWQRGRAAADFYLVRGIVERLADGLRIPPLRFERGDDSRLHTGRSAAVFLAQARIGYVGELNPTLSAGLTAKERIVVAELDAAELQRAAGTGRRFTPLSPYPSVTRDLAPRVSLEIPYAQVRASVDATDVSFLERVTLTDVFTGPPLPEGTKSLTLSFTFRSSEGTLTEETINEALARIRTALESSCGATFVG